MPEPPVPQEIRDDDILLALEKVPVEFRGVVLTADVEEFSNVRVSRALQQMIALALSSPTSVRTTWSTLRRRLFQRCGMP